MTPSLFFVIAGYSTAIGLSHGFYLAGVPSIITRKVAHVLGALITIFLPHWLSLTEALWLGGIFTVILVTNYVNRWLPSLHDSKSLSHGSWLFPLGCILTIYGFWNQPVALQGALLIYGLADSGAGLVGHYFGKHPYRLFGSKSLEGSLAFWMITMIILFVMSPSGSSGWTILWIGLVLTAAEGIASYGTDNVVVPLLAASLIQVFL